MRTSVTTKHSCQTAARQISICALYTAILLSSALATAGPSLQFFDQTGKSLNNVVVWAYSDTPMHTPVSTPGRAEVDQRNKRFEPYVSVVTTDTEVFFPNSDDIRHHVYSFSAGNTFERKLYRADEADPFLAKNPGIIALGCNIHDNMQAYVVVSDETTIMSDINGQLRIPNETTHLRVWHPLLGAEPLETSLSSLESDTANGYVIRLPFTWSDPQAPRSNAQLESLLKQFSRDPQ